MRSTTVSCWLLCVALGIPAVGNDDPSPLPKPVGQPADMSKPVQVFILLGQSNMVGLGKVSGSEVSLEQAVKVKHKYSYLVDESGAWSERKDVRYVRVMDGRGGGTQLFNNEWMTVSTCRTIGPEFGIGHTLGNAIDAPVMVLKSCIGNRSLGWDLLPPGSERYAFVVKDRQGVEKNMVYAGYGDRPEAWEIDPQQGLDTQPGPWLDKSGKPIDWYAGKQYDSDIGKAHQVLTELDKYYPEATRFEVAGFFFWQGEKDVGNPGHASRYELNLVRFIKQLRTEFKAPQAKFVLATLGESTHQSSGPAGMVFQAQLAVDGKSGKYPEFRGNVATVYSHPMAQGGSGNGHYGGKAEVYMDVGQAMGKAMVEFLQGTDE